MFTLKLLLRKTDILKTSIFLSLIFFLSRLDFGELQLTQISLNFKAFCYNLKIRGLGAKLRLVYYFNFGRNQDALR